MSNRLLRTRDVAAVLDVSTETILRWHRSGKLPGGRRLDSSVLRFDRDELEAWLDGTRTPRRLRRVVSVRGTKTHRSRQEVPLTVAALAALDLIETPRIPYVFGGRGGRALGHRRGHDQEAADG